MTFSFGWMDHRRADSYFVYTEEQFEKLFPLLKDYTIEMAKEEGKDISAIEKSEEVSKAAYLLYYEKLYIPVMQLLIKEAGAERLIEANKKCHQDQ